MPDDRLPALEEIRERAEVVKNAGHLTSVNAWSAAHERSAHDVPCLLAALDAVLKQHQPGRITLFGALCKRHESHRHFSITSTEAADVQACQDCTATVYNSCTGCGPQVNVDLCPTRNAITRTLTGEGDGG